VEKSLVLDIHGQTILEVLVVLKEVVDEPGEGSSLLNVIRMSATVLAFDLCGRTDDGAKLGGVLASELDHHVHELLPLENTVLVVVVLAQHLGYLFVGDLSVAQIHHDVLKFIFVHHSVLVQVVVFKASDEGRSLLRTEGLFLVEGEFVGWFRFVVHENALKKLVLFLIKKI